MNKTQVLDSTAPQVSAPDAVDPTPEDQLRLLHVEDNPADALLMQEYLRGVLPDVVFDTAARLAELTPDRAATADCALLDLSLPDASGLDAVLALRGMSENLPIIVLTGFDNLELGLAAVRGGADDYLLKSHVDGYSLERAVQYAVERRRLMLEVASSTFTAASATAAAKVAIAATETTDIVPAEAEQTAAHALTGAGGDRDEHQPQPAVGTHEVSVRIDAETGDFALRCMSCDWQAGRGPDVLHSWNDRSLDVVLLHHLDYSGVGQVAAAKPESLGSSVPRRRMLRPRTWLPAGAAKSGLGASGTSTS